MKWTVLFGLGCMLSLPAYSQARERTFVIDGWNLPVTVVVLKDVQVATSEQMIEESLQPFSGSRSSSLVLGIRKAAQFQMVEIHGEGGCLITFEDKDYRLASCPWLPGFRDHEEDTFMVLHGEPAD